MAVQLFSYNFSMEEITSILQLKVRNSVWTPTEFHQKYFDLHNCSTEELAEFWPISESDQLYSDNLMCFDHSDLSLYGDFESSSGSFVAVTVEIKPEHCLGRKQDSVDKNLDELTVDDFEQERVECVVNRDIQ